MQIKMDVFAVGFFLFFFGCIVHHSAYASLYAVGNESASVEQNFYKINFENSGIMKESTCFVNGSFDLSAPNMNDNQVMAWFTLAVADIMGFKFSNYKDRFKQTEHYFSDNGLQSFRAYLEQHNIIQMVDSNQLIVTAVPSAAPVIHISSVNNGVYHWVINLPLVLEYRGGKKFPKQKVLLTGTVVRSNDSLHPYGIAINEWSATVRP